MVSDRFDMRLGVFVRIRFFCHRTLVLQREVILLLDTARSELAEVSASRMVFSSLTATATKFDARSNQLDPKSKTSGAALSRPADDLGQHARARRASPDSFRS
jgi:hypothetical protein